MPTMKELERWMGTGQVAKRVGVSRQRVAVLAHQRRIRGVLTGAGWLFDPDDVEDFASKREKGRE